MSTQATETEEYAIETEEINEIVDEEEIEEEEVVVSIGEEAPPPEEHTQAPEWVRELRKTNRELQRQNRELQTKLQAAPPETKPVMLGKKPSQRRPTPPGGCWS